MARGHLGRQQRHHGQRPLLTACRADRWAFASRAILRCSRHDRHRRVRACASPPRRRAPPARRPRLRDRRDDPHRARQVGRLGRLRRASRPRRARFRLPRSGPRHRRGRPHARPQRSRRQPARAPRGRLRRPHLRHRGHARRHPALARGRPRDAARVHRRGTCIPHAFRRALAALPVRRAPRGAPGHLARLPRGGAHLGLRQRRGAERALVGPRVGRSRPPRRAHLARPEHHVGHEPPVRRRRRRDHVRQPRARARPRRRARRVRGHLARRGGQKEPRARPELRDRTNPDAALLLERARRVGPGARVPPWRSTRPWGSP
jgi:hypothetical protein